MSDEDSNKGRKGREFELLVKRIKEHQSPEAVVVSPEFVPDVDTGQPREVDVSIRLKQNEKPIFIAVECRDRISDQSVEWIEQLICKKSSINADVLVAITNSRFTTPARIKALKHGVILAEMSSKIPEELSEIASSFFITLRYLAPIICGIDLQMPSTLKDDIETYRYWHESVDRDLSLIELASVITTPNLVRTIPRFVEDWGKSKYAKIEPKNINAWVFFNGEKLPIPHARLSYELNYGEVELPLRAVQELSKLDRESDGNASVYTYGSSNNLLSEIIVDESTGELRWDLLGKSLSGEGKVIIGAKLRASKPVSITTMRLEL